MDNMYIYNEGRAVPANAMRPIQSGRLKGKTDINPMWRIKKLTELFGPCGVGWTVKILNIDYLPHDRRDGEEQIVSVMIEMKISDEENEAYSDPIIGIGGAKLISRESSGLYYDDEAIKKAYTDAISVACKALGIGANVYWEKDTSKYDVNIGIESNKKRAVANEKAEGVVTTPPTTQNAQGTLGNGQNEDADRKNAFASLSEALGKAHLTPNQADTVATALFKHPVKDCTTVELAQLVQRINSRIKEEQ